MKINGKILQICCTCLSTDRRLVSMALADHESLFTMFNIDFNLDEDLVCWECLAFLKRIYMFKAQVLSAQNTVKSWAGSSLKSLSRLSMHTKQTYDVTYNYVNVIIKLEPEIDLPKNENKPSTSEIKSNDITNETSKTNTASLIDRKTIKCDSNTYFMEMNTLQSKENKAECHGIKQEFHNYKRKIGQQTLKSDNGDISEKNKTKCNVKYNPKKLLQRKKNLKFNYASKKGRESSYITKIMTEQEMLHFRDSERNEAKFKSFPYKCDKCIMGYYDEVLYNRHLNEKHSKDSGRHICSICEQHFKKEESLSIHKVDHYRKYCCKFCDYTGLRIRRMITHLYIHEAKAKCEECHRVFQTPRALRYHLEVAHKEERYICDICKKSYMVKSSLAKHMVAVHCSEEVKTDCPVCGKRVNKRIMHVHLQSHAPAEENAYCIECDKQFPNAISYRRHLKWSPKHVKKEDYKHTCDVCGLKFLYKNKFLKHYSVVHLRQYPYKCDICDKGFGVKKKMEQHVLVKHFGGTVPPVKDKLCEVCGKGFKNRYILKNHMRIHTGEKPCMCDLCGCSFAQSGSLRNHVKTVHLKIKPTIKHKRVWKKKKRVKNDKALS